MTSSRLKAKIANDDAEKIENNEKQQAAAAAAAEEEDIYIQVLETVATDDSTPVEAEDDDIGDLTTMQGIASFADSTAMVLFFSISFMLNSVPNIIAYGSIIAAEGSKPALAVGLIFTVCCGLLEMVVISVWARRHSNTFFYTLAIHFFNQIGLWLFIGLAAVQTATPALRNAAIGFASAGLVVVLPIHFYEVWSRAHKAPPKSEKVAGVSAMTCFGDVTDDYIVGSFLALCVLTQMPILIMQGTFIYTAQTRKGVAVVALLVLVCTTVGTVWIPLRWLHRRHPMVAYLAIMMLVTNGLVWLSTAISFSFSTALGKAELAFSVLSFFVSAVQLNYVDAQLARVKIKEANRDGREARRQADKERRAVEGKGCCGK